MVSSAPNTPKAPCRTELRVSADASTFTVHLTSSGPSQPVTWELVAAIVRTVLRQDDRWSVLIDVARAEALDDASGTTLLRLREELESSGRTITFIT